jgi:hypothetical protein
MDLRTSEYRLAVSVSSVAGVGRQPSKSAAVHRFNHLEFNSDDSRFVFLHRWRHGCLSAATMRQLAASAAWWQRCTLGRHEFSNMRPGYRLRACVWGLDRLVDDHYGGGGLTRLCTAAADGSDIRIRMDEYLASHFAWRDPRHLLVWGRRGGHDNFYLIDDLTGEASPVAPDVLTEDGHCTYSPGRRWILGDTYPDGDRKRALYVYDTLTGRRLSCGEFHSPPELSGELRCDLHPRWNRDGRQICFDSAHEGTRQIYVSDAPFAQESSD